MSIFTKKRHLKYDSIEEWIVGEKIPMPLSKVNDSKLFDKYMEEHSELRRHLFGKHLQTLSPIERSLLKDGRHPSQSHSRSGLAQEYVEAFKKDFSQIKSVKQIGLGNYHADRLVIDVAFSEWLDPLEMRRQIPQFYRGFEVMCLMPKADHIS